jgi:chitin disaccharide deacetylase
MAEARRVQITADDFGLSSATSRGVIRAMLEGVVGVASAMVCRPGALDDLRNLPRALRQRVGLHLQLTDGTPRCPHLPLASGADRGFAQTRSQLARPDAALVLAEFTAQLQAFEGTGLVPHHLDSHHDVHQFPSVFAPLCQLARARELPIRALSPQMSRRLRQLGIRCLDTVVTPWPSVELNAQAFVEAIVSAGKRLPEQASVEVSCHPGYSDLGLAATSSYTHQRELELAVLVQPDLPAALRAAGLVLVEDGAH